MQTASHLRRRLQKLECRRREEQSFALVPGEARRLMEAKLDAVRQRMQPAIDQADPNWREPTAEETGEARRRLSEFFAGRGWHDAAHAVLGESCEM